MEEPLVHSYSKAPLKYEHSKIIPNKATAGCCWPVKSSTALSIGWTSNHGATAGRRWCAPLFVCRFAACICISRVTASGREQAVANVALARKVHVTELPSASMASALNNLFQRDQSEGKSTSARARPFCDPVRLRLASAVNLFWKLAQARARRTPSLRFPTRCCRAKAPRQGFEGAIGRGAKLRQNSSREWRPRRAR